MFEYSMCNWIWQITTNYYSNDDDNEIMLEVMVWRCMSSLSSDVVSLFGIEYASVP